MPTFAAVHIKMRRHIPILTELPKLEGQCDDKGRLANIRCSVMVTLITLHTMCACLGEVLVETIFSSDSLSSSIGVSVAEIQ